MGLVSFTTPHHDFNFQMPLEWLASQLRVKHAGQGKIKYTEHMAVMFLEDAVNNILRNLMTFDHIQHLGPNHPSNRIFDAFKMSFPMDVGLGYQMTPLDTLNVVLKVIKGQDAIERRREYNKPKPHAIDWQEPSAYPEPDMFEKGQPVLGEDTHGRHEIVVGENIGDETLEWRVASSGRGFSIKRWSYLPTGQAPVDETYQEVPF